MGRINPSTSQKILIEKIKIPTLKEILKLSDDELDNLFEVLDLGGLDDPWDGKTDFSVDDCKYKCQLSLETCTNDPTEKVLEFKFVLTDGPNKPDRNNFDTNQQYVVALHHWSIGIVGVSHPIKALRNALQVLSRYIRSYKPKYVTFSANEKNRQKLYGKFFARYGHYIPNYKLIDINPDTGEKVDDKEFWLERFN